jgi:pilus assembly protein Flp/PilA
MSFFQRIRKNDSGATAVEYGLIIALIAVVSVGTIKSIGININAKLNIISANLD